MSCSTKGYSNILNGRFKDNHALITRVVGAMGQNWQGGRVRAFPGQNIATFGESPA